MEEEPFDGVLHHTRHFSPAFYADLLESLGVHAIACLGRSSCEAAPIESRGIATVDLQPNPRRPSLLGSLDMLLTFSLAGPGAVAIYSGTGPAWPAHAAPLVSAFLMSRCKFCERGSMGWLLLVCPWLLAAKPHQPPPLPPPSEGPESESGQA